MRFKRQIELKKGQLDIAPLIDVVFLLLIFFMLTSSFISSKGIKVNLPTAISAKPISLAELVIFMDKESKLTVDDKEITKEALAVKIKDVAEAEGRILIKADKSAPLGRVVDIWDLCRDAGVENVNVATAEGKI